MAFLKGTAQQCKAYDELVTSNMNYAFEEDHWANIIERESGCFITKHPDFESEEMEVMEMMPDIEYLNI